MKLTLVHGLWDSVIADILFITIFDGSLSIKENKPILCLNPLMQQQISNFREVYPRCVNYGEYNLIHLFGDFNVRAVLLIGAGKPVACTRDKIRSLFGSAVRAVHKFTVKTILLYANLSYVFNEIIAAQTILEGMVLGSYKFDIYKSKKNEKIHQIFLAGVQTESIERMETALYQTHILTDSVNLCRDLINHPACYITPAFMAERAQNFRKYKKFTVDILEETAIQELGMNAFLAVAKGSDQSPRLIIIRYQGNPDNEELLAYVGKGITFDSGGISLKSSVNMGDMKSDMAGAAAVLYAMRAIGKLQPQINIIAVLPCCENMPSGHAVRPSDVVKSLDGTTIEIDNTDAEGRLVLADAISYAIQLGATKIVDIATLTGACVVALGNTAAGVVSNDDVFCQKVLSAAGETGEKMWRMPIYEEYKESLQSDIADIKNTGGRSAGMIKAGIFIQHFVKGIPWVHLDIAGVAYLKQVRGINPKGAAGFGVKTLVQLAMVDQI
jgi:leucyl aminopeptidase